MELYHLLVVVTVAGRRPLVPDVAPLTSGARVELLPHKATYFVLRPLPRPRRHPLGMAVVPGLAGGRVEPVLHHVRRPPWEKVCDLAPSSPQDNLQQQYIGEDEQDKSAGEATGRRGKTKQDSVGLDERSLHSWTRTTRKGVVRRPKTTSG